MCGFKRHGHHRGRCNGDCSGPPPVTKASYSSARRCSNYVCLHCCINSWWYSTTRLILLTEVQAGGNHSKTWEVEPTLSPDQNLAEFPRGGKPQYKTQKMIFIIWEPLFLNFLLLCHGFQIEKTEEWQKQMFSRMKSDELIHVPLVEIIWVLVLTLSNM